MKSGLGTCPAKKRQSPTFIVGEKFTLRTFTGCQRRPLCDSSFFKSLSGTRMVRLAAHSAPGRRRLFTPIELLGGGTGMYFAQMPSTSWKLSRSGS